MPLDIEVGLGPGDFVLDGDPASPLEQGTSLSHFSAHVYCGQTAGWIKMPLDMEVGLGPADCQMGTQFPPARKDTAAPNFRPMCIMAKRLDGSRCHLVVGNLVRR